jgi:hypothetical protein
LEKPCKYAACGFEKSIKKLELDFGNSWFELYAISRSVIIHKTVNRFIKKCMNFSFMKFNNIILALFPIYTRINLILIL